MNNKKLNILIAETDNRFRNELTEIFYGLKLNGSFFDFNIIRAVSIEEIKLIFESNQIDLAFIDYLFFIETENELKKINMNCHLVILIPDEGGDKIYEIIENIGKHKSLHLSGHILKDNYSKELIKVMAKIFLNKLQIDTN